MGIQAAAKAPARGLDRKDLTGPALRTFFRIADAWGLKEQEQMRLLGLRRLLTHYFGLIMNTLERWF